jgi:hypothetical protein
MDVVEKEQLKVALVVIKAVQKIAEAEGVPAPNPERALDTAFELLQNDAMPVDVLAPKIMERWKEDVSNIQKHFLALAEQITPARFVLHSNADDDTKAEAQAFIDELVERNKEALRGLARDD